MPGHGLKILVVEDNQSVGGTLASALEQEGCTAILTHRCEQVAALAQRARPHLITLDLAHAELRSCDVIDQLRSDPSTREIPIIALSARAGNLPPPRESNIARVFGEPFYPAEVVLAVLETLGRGTN